MISAQVKAIKRLHREASAYKAKKAKGFEAGVRRASLFIQRESQKIVPVDTGALRNSAFTRIEGRGLNTEGRVGYTMDYAIYVHENLEARHAKGKTAKYLERPLRLNRKRIREIIKEEMNKRKHRR